MDLAFPLAALLLTRQVLSFFLPSLFLGITGLKSGGSRSRKAVQDFGLHRSHEEFLFDTLLIKSFMCFGVITLNLNLNQDQWHGHRWLSPPAASRAACPSSTALPARPATHHDPSQATPIAATKRCNRLRFKPIFRDTFRTYGGVLFLLFSVDTEKIHVFTILFS